MQKGFALILSILVGVLVIGVLIITSQTPQPSPDETANWKVYKDASYGYEIKYPPVWSIKTANNVISFYPAAITPEVWRNIQQSIPVSEPNVSIKMLSTPFIQSISSNLLQPIAKSQFILQPKIITVDQIQGYYYQPLCAPQCPIYINLPYDDGNKTLQLSLSLLGKDNIEYIRQQFNVEITDADENTFLTMISTLKLNTNFSTADWKTYTNTKYSYEIKYPPNWFLNSFYPDNIKLKSDEYNWVHISPMDPDKAPELITTGLLIKILDNNNNYSSKDYVSKVILPANAAQLKAFRGELPVELDPKNIKISPITLNNSSAVMVYGLDTHISGFSNEGPQVFISNNKYVIDIVSFIYYHDPVTMLQIDSPANGERKFKQILSTFKLLK